MNIFKPIVDFLFPPVCEVCGKLLTGGERIVCKDCLSNITPSLIRRKQIKGLEYIDEISAYGKYSTPLDEIIKLFKYDGKVSLKEKLVNLLFITYLTHYKNIPIDFITTVPLHRVKKRERGYNQSEMIARGLSEIIGIPYREALKRKRNTPSQTKMDPKMRSKNVKDAFECILEIKGCILIIDDVMTTGSTLNECAKKLKEMGAQCVIGLVLATAD